MSCSCPVQHEATIQRLEEDTAELMAQLQQRSRDLTSLSAEKSRLELELVLITEKHHTAQHEVGHNTNTVGNTACYRTAQPEVEKHNLLPHCST